MGRLGPDFETLGSAIRCHYQPTNPHFPIAIFEEAAHTLDIPGATKMISKQTTFV
jgi:hypothetical protein